MWRGFKDFKHFFSNLKQSWRARTHSTPHGQLLNSSEQHLCDWGWFSAPKKAKFSIYSWNGSFFYMETWLWATHASEEALRRELCWYSCIQAYHKCAKVLNRSWHTGGLLIFRAPTSVQRVCGEPFLGFCPQDMWLHTCPVLVAYTSHYRHVERSKTFRGLRIIIDTLRLDKSWRHIKCCWNRFLENPNESNAIEASSVRSPAALKANVWLSLFSHLCVWRSRMAPWWDFGLYRATISLELDQWKCLNWW